MIESVLRLIRRGKPEAEGLDVFSSLMLASALERSLHDIDSDRLARFAQAAFAHLMRKPAKRHAINFRTSDLLGAIAGAPAAATVLEILNDDMPFVVESVISELHARGLLPRLVFHPIFKVERADSGRLQAVVGPGDRHWAAGDQESYVAILLEPLTPAQQRELAQGLDAVLDDVRLAAFDLEAMKGRIAQAATAYEQIQLGSSSAPGAPAPLELEEAIDFLRWLVQGNFTPLGLRDYEVVGTHDSFDLSPAATGALGIMRNAEPGGGDGAMTAAIRDLYNAPAALIFSKATEVSRVRQRVPLDCIGIKRYGPAGNLLGEVRLVGLFTPASYMQPVETVPVVRHKVRRVLADAQFPADSHNGRTLIDILETFPRDELWQIDQRRLHDWSMTLLDVSLRPRATVLTRRGVLGRTTSALAFVPRDHYSSAVRERIAAYLESRIGGKTAAFYPYISASPLVRTHLVIVHDSEPPRQVPDEELATGVAGLIRTWDEHLSDALARNGPTDGISAVPAAYRGAFSAGYREMFPVERAVEDIARIERLGPDMPVAIDFNREADAPTHRTRAAIYRFDAPIALSERVPLLENMGFKVIDERSYRIHPRRDGEVRDVVLHDMMLETANGAALDLPRHEVRMEEAFLAVFRGQAESDLFNALVIAAGLDWREAAVMRALAAYMRQMRAPFSQRYIAETLVRYPAIARDLYDLLAARCEPAGVSIGDSAEARAGELRQRIETALATVQGLDEDRILRRLTSIVMAVLRTNVLLRDDKGQPPAALAFKLASRDIDRLPEPRPFREIFVYSPRVEGVHLRFAPIARGGIRWSDRLQDYRTEILGLAKAQQVKNTVIVPTGAKGGFVPKQIRRDATREEVQADGVACYRTFIGALLSLTDDIREGAIVPPAGIARRDGADPYLVVAADKGTATFSDHANAIALERGFWLGDAFASGGSAGYDHKRMGITARGAWECVKRHFRELETDIHKQPFRVIGVGDMSGDVFGNAMLLSTAIRLVAAFDHRDIFIDPDPDPELAFAERKRLFELPRSSWSDYDRARISAGGGVFSRTAKSIALSPQMRALLGVEAAQLPPAELMQAILRCEMDLLWLGGIGSFVRESGETDEQVGDRANDAVRVTAAELRTKVIGEGANLGLTQRARIEAATRGVRLNTDFIDNSAGVNTSDQEVNIKIALAPALAQRRLSREDRDRLLASMSSDVATAVLANNRAQALALSLAEADSRRDLGAYVRLVRHLEERGLIDRKLEALPSGAELSQRASSVSGLTRPELAVLMSWAKIGLSADLLSSALPDGPEADATLVAYFPTALRESFRADILEHPLRREIVATHITNTVINTAGPAAMMRLAGEAGTSMPTPVLVEAFLAARKICGLDRDWTAVDELGGRVAGSVQLELFRELQEHGVQEAVRLLAERGERSFPALVAVYGPAARELGRDVRELMPPGQQRSFDTRVGQLQERGVPVAIAMRHAGLVLQRRTLALVDRAAETGADVRETARVLLGAQEYLSLGELSRRAAKLEPADDYDRQAIEAALGIVETAGHVLGNRMLADPGARGMPIATWAAAHAAPLLAARPLIDNVLAEPGLSIARLGVIADSVRSVAAMAMGPRKP